jgi:hypothetical protein
VVLGGGVLGLLAGAAFGVWTLTEAKAQKDDCGSPVNCNAHSAALTDHTRAETYGTVSTISFIAGGALSVLGITLLATSGSASHPDGAALRLEPVAGPGVQGVALRGGF